MKDEEFVFSTIWKTWLRRTIIIVSLPFILLYTIVSAAVPAVGRAWTEEIKSAIRQW